MDQLNGIPILTWHDDKADEELPRLIPLLEYMSTVDDVRRVIGKVVVNEKVDYNIVNKLLQNNIESRIAIKSVPRLEPNNLGRNKSSDMFSSNVNYDRKIQEWNELKGKVGNNLEECSGASLIHHDTCFNPDNNSNIHSSMLCKSFRESTPNRNQYKIDNRTRCVDEEKKNESADIMSYSASRVNSYFWKSNQSFLKDDIKSQASSLCHLKSTGNKDLNRNSSCKCIRSDENEFNSSNNISNNTNYHINFEHSYFRHNHMPSSKNNCSNFYKAAEEEEEEEKNTYKQGNDSKLYSSWNSHRSVYTNTPQKIVNQCNTNYLTTIKKNPPNKKLNEKKMLTPSPFPQREKNEEKKNASLASTKKRLLFNSSTMGNDYSFLLNSNNSNYNTQRYVISKKENNLSNTSNQLYRAIDKKRSYLER